MNPLDDGSLANYRVLRVPMTSLTKEVCAPLGVKPRDAERSKNFFALGLVSFMFTRPIDPTLDWISEKFGTNEQVEAANKASFLAGFNFGETTEAVGHRYEVKPAKLPGRGVHEHHRQHGARLGHHRRRPVGEAPDHTRFVPDHAGERHPPRTLEAQALRDPHRAGRRRDRRDRHGARGRVRRPPRSDHHERPRCRPQERDHVARGVDRAAAADRRHPARRTVDRTADEDRGLRSQHRAVRTPRRSTPADRRRIHPGTVLPRRDRGHPHRPEVPDAGDPAVRWVSGQRLRAVEHSVDRHVAGHLGAVHHRTESRRRGGQRRVLAVPPRRDHAGTAVGHSRVPPG